MPHLPLQLSPHSFLELMWLASPALPIGGFSYSEGLEAAINATLISNEKEAAQWLQAQLHLTQSRGDMVALARAVSAWAVEDYECLAKLNTWVRTTRESSELRLQTEQMGRSLVEWLKTRYPGDAQALQRTQWLAEQDATYPITFALAASLAGASAHDALLAYLFGWAENMVQAAIKAVPLGQSAGQRILAQLTQEIPAAVERSLATEDGEQQAFSPMLAILSARHEHQYSRLFRS